MDGVPREDAVNTVLTTCRDVMYVGDQTRYEVEIAAGLRLVLRVQNLPGSSPYAIGERLRIEWRADDLRVFAAEGFADLPAVTQPGVLV
jgi:hypothetical protein